MNDWKVIFATVVIFGTGVITGGLLVNYVEHYHPHAALAHKPAAPGGTNTSAANSPNVPIIRQSEILNKPAFLAFLDTQLTEDKLPLTAEQHKAIETLINEGQGQMRKVTQDVDRSIRDALNPEQRKKYDEMRKASHPNKANHPLPPGTNAPAMTNSAMSVPAFVATNLPPVATNAPVN